MEKGYYPEDKPVKDWIHVAAFVANGILDHIIGWKDNYCGSAVKETVRDVQAHTRGLQQAQFRIQDEADKERLDCDDLMDAVTLFYLAAMKTVAFLEEMKESDNEPVALRAAAENLLEVSEAWYEAYGAKPPKKALFKPKPKPAPETAAAVVGEE